MSVTLEERVTLTRESGRKLDNGRKVALVFIPFKLIFPETGIPLLVTTIVEELRLAGFIGSEKIKTTFAFIGTPVAPSTGTDVTVGETVSVAPPVTNEPLKA
jgi:hypothetical protein